MSIIHPDTQIHFEVETSYEHVVALQPDVEIALEIETDYTPPSSTGGQPSVVITLVMSSAVIPTSPTVDVRGSAHITHSVSGRLSSVVPPQEPNDFTYEDVDIVAVKMPKPTTFDRFGRPTG